MIVRKPSSNFGVYETDHADLSVLIWFEENDVALAFLQLQFGPVTRFLEVKLRS